jgi:hypothetical protein
MTIDIDATYRDGAIHPDTPLNLPNNTPVRVSVVAKSADFPPIPFPTNREEVLAIRPKSPKITLEQFDALTKNFSISAPSLPDDFSRADIYSDHD